MTDTAFRPALREELDHLDPRLVPLRMTMIVTKRQDLLDSSGTLLPEFFDGLVVQAVAQGTKNDPRQFALGKTWVEGFEPSQFLDHRWRHAGRFALGYEDDILREEPEQALLLEATREITHRFNVGLGFLSALLRGTIGKQDERPNQLIAPLESVDKVQLQLGNISGGVHACPLSGRVPPSGRSTPVFGDHGMLVRGALWVACPSFVWEWLARERGLL